MAKVEKVQSGKEQEDPSLQGQEDIEDGGQETKEKSEDQQDGQTSEEEESPFQHPMLRGKSPEEIERVFSLQAQALKEQNAELNRYHSQSQERAPAPGERPAPKEEEEGDPYGDSFLAPHLRTLENRLSRQLKEMVSPLQKSLATRGSTDARSGLRTRLRFFEGLEPYIDKHLRENGVDPGSVDESQLTTIYHALVGQATEQNFDLSGLAGNSNNNNESHEEPPRREGGRMISQRRPSSAPLPREKKSERRQLTESERRLAREFGMTDEEYLTEQERDEEEVVSPGFSKEDW